MKVSLLEAYAAVAAVTVNDKGTCVQTRDIAGHSYITKLFVQPSPFYRPLFMLSSLRNPNQWPNSGIVTSAIALPFPLCLYSVSSTEGSCLEEGGPPRTQYSYPSQDRQISPDNYHRQISPRNSNRTLTMDQGLHSQSARGIRYSTDESWSPLATQQCHRQDGHPQYYHSRALQATCV
jgi:hypothetical protein